MLDEGLPRTVDLEEDHHLRNFRFAVFKRYSKVIVRTKIIDK